MTDPIRTITVNKNTINIFQDDQPWDPREWDNYSIMACFHNRYTLGDKHEYDHADFSSWDELEAQIREDHDPVIILPLYLYDHSGISISTRSFIGRAQHASWDSGQVGFVYTTRDQVELMQGWKRITKARREDLEKWVVSEVETYNQYLTGDVYGYQVQDEAGEDLGSCWGYFGIDNCIEEARSIAA